MNNFFMPDEVTQKIKKKGKSKEQQAKRFQGFMAAWFRQYYKYVTIFSCFALFLLGYFFALNPKLGAARLIASEKIVLEQKKKAGLESKLKYLQDLDVKRKNFSAAEIEKFNSTLPAKPLTSELLAVLEEIARASNVLIEGMEFVVVDENSDAVDLEQEFSYLPANVRTIDVNLSVRQGPYDSLKLLMDNIEKSLRLMDVVSLQYSPVGNSYNLTLRSYYQIQ